MTVPAGALAIDVSVIIINYKSVDFLRLALTSLKENASKYCGETIVVDNASGDRCGEMLRAEFPAIHFIPSLENLGFAGGNNLAVAHATGRYLLFLNPDTEVRGNSVDRMISFLDKHPTTGIVGPMLLNGDNSVQTSCIRAFPTILSEVVDSDLLRKRFPGWSLWGSAPLWRSKGQPTPVDAVSGASLMIRKDTFESIGMFSTSYFMYAEDVDLCYRAHQKGWGVYFIPEATVVHFGGQSSGAAEDRHFADVLLRESRFLFFRKHRGRFYSFAYRLSTAVSALSRMALLRLALVLRPKPSLHQALSKWSRIWRWCLGMEQWAKKVR